jgi:hypothetical protein
LLAAFRSQKTLERSKTEDKGYVKPSFQHHHPSSLAYN